MLSAAQRRPRVTALFAVAFLSCFTSRAFAFTGGPSRHRARLRPGVDDQFKPWGGDSVGRAASPDPNNDSNSSPADRFISPRIDDVGLPLADALVAQIVAPSFQVFWLAVSRSPLPTWLQPISSSLWGTARGSLVAPTLIHGAGLACCWVAGALAAKAFESDAFNVSGGRGYSTVITRIIKAGAFATGMLIFSTQVDLLFEFGRYVQLGESEDTDLRILTAAVEVVNDIFFEAVALSSWRIYRASLTANNDSF